MTFDLQRNTGESTKEYIYRSLKTMIMSLDLPPGTTLSENEIAKDFDISRTPIREVLKRLEKERLVEIIPQTGTKVSLINSNLFNQVFFMRYAIEKEIIREIQLKITDEDLKILEDMLSLQEFYYYKNMATKFQDSDNEFHKELYKISNKILIWETIKSLSFDYDRIRLLLLMNGQQSDIGLILKDHQDILNCIKNKSSYEEIDILLKNHIVKPSEHWNMLFKNPMFKDFIK